MPQNEPSEPAPNGQGPPAYTADKSLSPYMNGEGPSRLAPALREKFKADPALEAPGVAPNYAQFPLPHVMTLQGLVSSISRTYRISDEALNDSFDNARFMEYDVGIRECLDARMRSSVLLDWHIEPENEKDVEQTLICGELTKIVKSISRWYQILEQWAWATWWGRSAIQFKMGWSQVGGKWYVMPVEWLPIHGDKLVFRLMDDRLDHPQNQIGIRVGQTYHIGDRISKGPGREGEFWQVEPTDRGLAYFLNDWEAKQVVIHKHQIQDAAFERPTDAGRIHGVGIRSVVYWEWFMEKNTLQWLMEYVERSAFGLELWYYPLGNEKARLDAETAVKNRVGPFKNVIFAPVPPDDGPGRQYGVDHVETGAQGAEVVHEIVKYFERRRKRYILGQVLTTEAEATGLGGNLASIHLLSFRDIVKYDCKNRDETATTFINQLKAWNFPGNANWKARYVTETEPVDADERLAAMKTAQDLGAEIRKADVYQAAGLTPPGPEDDIATPAAAMGIGPDGQPMMSPGMGGPNDESDFAPDMDTAPEPAEQFADQDLRNRIAAAAKQTNKPSKRQREAGNYKKGHVSIQGIPVVIENPAGSYRHYTYGGKKGKQKLAHHYGYIQGTEGSDDGQLDCFIGPDPESELVYIVNQVVPKTGKWDELKVLIGWYCEDEAREGYNDNYQPGWKGLGSMIRMTMPQFKEWLAKGNQRRSMVRQTAFYSSDFERVGGPMEFNGEFF